MRGFFAAAALTLALCVAPASAQMGNMGDKETPLQKQEKLKEMERKAVEQDYDKAMKRSKSQVSSDASASDPWANVRPAAATAKPRPRCSSTLVM